VKIDKSYIGKKAIILVDHPNGAIFKESETVILESIELDGSSGKFARIDINSESYSQARYLEFKYCDFEVFIKPENNKPIEKAKSRLDNILL
jgi:hypothetical protein